jgi:hypothetical protein
MTKRPDASYNLCTFKFANGKFCTMPAHPNYDGLCLNHATIHRRTFHREDDLVKELASPAGDFITQIDINHVLGKLFDALAANRVSPKRAATLAYIGHLLMQSQNGARYEANNWATESKVLSKLIDIKYPSEPTPDAASPAPPCQPSLSRESAQAMPSREGGSPAPSPKSPPKS